MMKMEQVSKEAFYTRQSITEVNDSTVDFLRGKVDESPRKRVRLCLHDDVENPLHEMAIVLGRGSYIRPHKHEGKTESFHIIEGRLSVVFFDDQGRVEKVIRMGPCNSGLTFFYRLATSCFHSVIPESEYVIFHETTNGPFNPEETEYAKWAPPETAEEKACEYVEVLLANHIRK
jgi:cupin fold WbuC family metalloprotein|tara:strand:+ start:1086 stop:1610 length:525 start_codon:yes stop_codon:yes gene_type:complete